MNKTNVTVVIPLYNKELYIKRALESIFLQTINNFEIIVVDDGSTDKGPDIVQKINDPRVRLIQQKNAGVSAARNRGIEEAKGELIAFLDADDEWKPEFLETIVHLRSKYPDAGVYATAYNTLSADGIIMVPHSKPAGSGLKDNIYHNYFRAAVHKDVDIHISSVAIPKDIFKELGGFLVGERLGEDLELYCRVCMRYPIAFSYSSCSIYHQDVVNSAMQSNIVVNELPFAKTAQMAIASASVDSGLIRDLNEYITEHILWHARHHILTGNNTLSKTLLKQCDTSHFLFRKLWWNFWANMPVKITSSVFKIYKQCSHSN